MKHIVITGASGLVATALIEKILKESDYQLYLISNNPTRLQEKYKQNRINVFSLDTFELYCIEKTQTFDVCIHTAFARKSKGDQVVSSLLYLSKLGSVFKKSNLGLFVNLSSQSVYDVSQPTLWKESTSLCPDTLYGLGKYATEVITENIFSCTKTVWTNIRLCSICEVTRFVGSFVQNSLSGKPIHLTTPNYMFSLVDIRDVANALMILINHSHLKSLQPVYNLGSNISYSLRDIAHLVNGIGTACYGVREVDVTEDDNDDYVSRGVNSHLFMHTFNWTPLYSMNDMIISVFEKIKL